MGPGSRCSARPSCSAAAHVLGGSWLALPSIFLLGLILAAAYVATRSLPLVMGVHATFNCLSLAVLFLVGL